MIGIIGCGASGMLAAIMAAREGASVTVFEHNDRAGRKLLATGNGRCNLANEDQAIFRKMTCLISSAGSGSRSAANADTGIRSVNRHLL